MFHVKQSSAEAIERFADILYEWNDRMNLTSYTRSEFQNIGVFDCAVLADILAALGRWRFLDIGTGYGMPGFILKLLDPRFDPVLLDGSEKKIAFLTYAGTMLKVKFEAMQKRLPARQWRFTASCIVSKASMQEGGLLKVCEPLLEAGGVLAYFSGDAPPCHSNVLPLAGRVAYRRPDGSFSAITIRKKART